MVKRKKEEDKGRLMLLIAVFLLGYIFFAGGGFSKTGQLTRETYKLQQQSLDVDPHNIGAVKGPRQNPIYPPDVISGGSPSGSNQYLTASGDESPCKCPVYNSEGWTLISNECTYNEGTCGGVCVIESKKKRADPYDPNVWYQMDPWGTGKLQLYGHCKKNSKYKPKCGNLYIDPGEECETVADCEAEHGPQTEYICSNCQCMSVLPSGF